jgi:ribulose-phosphate 3-epimerase
MQADRAVVHGCALAPSLLQLDFRDLGATLSSVVPAADRLHVDVCDGQFCPAFTFGPDVVRAVAELSRLPVNVHLGMLRPDRWFGPFAEAGASWLTFHPGTVPDPAAAVLAIRAAGAAPGLALLPDEEPGRHVQLYPEVDVVVSLNVHPGVQGQAPVVDPVARTRQVTECVRDAGSSAVIEVDGGVGLESVPRLIAAGAGALSVGSRIFAADDPGHAARAFRDAVRHATGDRPPPPFTARRPPATYG